MNDKSEEELRQVLLRILRIDSCTLSETRRLVRRQKISVSLMAFALAVNVVSLLILLLK